MTLTNDEYDEVLNHYAGFKLQWPSTTSFQWKMIAENTVIKIMWFPIMEPTVRYDSLEHALAGRVNRGKDTDFEGRLRYGGR